MPVHIECAKRTFNVLTLSTKNCNVFSLGQRYSSASGRLLLILIFCLYFRIFQPRVMPSLCSQLRNFGPIYMHISKK